jgi:WD40 repeat protein
MPDHVVLHLSDLYFHSDENDHHINKLELLSNLIIKIQSLDSLWKPTILVVSGDVAYYGNHVDYELAYEWFSDALKLLDISPNNVVIVPGNHDINCSHPLLKGFLKLSEKDQVQLRSDQVLNTELLELISNPFSDFEEFCVNLGVSPYQLGTKNTFLSGVKVIDHLQFMVFNTAWHYTPHNNDSSKNLGKLFLGLPLWEAMLEHNINTSAELKNIAVWHHPPEYLHISELHEIQGRRAVFTEVAKHADLILTGHSHVDVSVSSNAQRTLPIFFSGSDQTRSPNHLLANLYFIPTSADTGKSKYLFSYSSEKKWEVGQYQNDLLKFKTKKSILRNLSESCLKRFTSLGGRFEHIHLDELLIPELKRIKEPFYDDFGNLLSPSDAQLMNETEASKLKETVEFLWRDDCKHFALTGDGGIGKTCSLLYLWKEYVKDIAKPIPIYIPLNEFDYFEQSDFSMQEYLVSKIHEYYFKPNPELGISLEEIKQIFFESNFPISSSGNVKFIFLLDSYYEISIERKELLKEIICFTQQSKSLQFIVACRYDFRKEDGQFSDWHGFTLCPLDDQVICRYLQNKEIIGESLDSAQVRVLPSILNTPMNLSIYVNSYWLMKEYPSHLYKKAMMSKGELFWNFIVALYQIMEHEHPAKDKAILSYGFIFLHLLPALAYEMDQESKSLISESLLSSFAQKLSKDFNAKFEANYIQSFDDLANEALTRDAIKSINSEDVFDNLKDLVDKNIVIFQCSVLVNGTCLYGFSHENYRETFLAMHILNECHFNNVKKDDSLEMIQFPEKATSSALIGEIDGIHYSIPYIDHNAQWKCKSLAYSIIWKQLELCRNKFDGSHADRVKKLIKIILNCRKELSGLDLSALDLSSVKLKNTICSRSKDFCARFEHSIIKENMILSYGHISSVSSVAYSPDGKTCISGSGDRTLKLWDVSTGACIRTFIGHDHFVRSVAYSPDGKTCLSASWDSTLKLWDINSGDCILTFTGHQYFVRSVAISPDGGTCISGSWDQSVKLWDISTGSCIRTFIGHDHFVRCVAYMNNGKTIISSSWDNTIKIWNVANGECIRSIPTDEHSFRSIAVSPDGKTCLCGSEDKNFFLWDIQEGSCLGSFQGHASSVRSVAFSEDGQKCLSGSADRTIKLWDVSSLTCIKTLVGHNHSVESVTISPNHKHCISGSMDRSLKLWDLETGYCLRTFTGFDHSVRSVSISQNKQYCISGTDDKSIKLWDTAKGKCSQTFLGHLDSVSAVAFHPSENTILSASWDSSLKLWDVNTGLCIKTYSGHSNSVLCCAFSPDGKTCLSGSWDNTLKWWDLSTTTCKRTYKGHASSVHAVAFSPDGKTCLSGSWDNTMKWWYLESSLCLRTFSGHFFFVRSVAFSPDGKTCLSGSEDNTLKLWDLHTGECLRTFYGHTYHVRSVAFSPDGKTCLSGSGDNTIKLWDIKNGRCIKTMEDHKHSVRSVAFSPDGKTCISASKDRTIKSWDLSSGKVIWSSINVTGLYMHHCSLKELHPESTLSEKSISLLKMYSVVFD